MNQKLKIAAATAAVSITGLSLAACGGSTDTSADAAGSQLAPQQTGTPPAGATGTTGTTGQAGAPGQAPPMGAGQAGAGGPFASLTSDDIKCLKTQGVTVPSGPPTQGSAPGQPGTRGGSSKQTRPPKADMPTPAAIKKAAKACNIDLPAPGSMGGPGGPPGAMGGPSGPPGA